LVVAQRIRIHIRIRIRVRLVPHAPLAGAAVGFVALMVALQPSNISHSSRERRAPRSTHLSATCAVVTSPTGAAARRLRVAASNGGSSRTNIRVLVSVYTVEDGYTCSVTAVSDF
jgi:hypothetical protein